MSVEFLDDDAIVTSVTFGVKTVDDGEEEEDEEPVSEELVPDSTATEALRYTDVRHFL